MDIAEIGLDIAVIGIAVFERTGNLIILYFILIGYNQIIEIAADCFAVKLQSVIGFQLFFYIGLSECVDIFTVREGIIGISLEYFEYEQGGHLLMNCCIVFHFVTSVFRCIHYITYIYILQ